jgi:hypothetical protein
MSDHQLTACQQYAKAFNQGDASQLVAMLADEVM